jgi:hypothetical protein
MSERALDLDTLFAEHSRSSAIAVPARSRHRLRCRARACRGARLPCSRTISTTPFRANAAFKAWAPLTDVPDSFIYFEPGRIAPPPVQQPARLLVQIRRLAAGLLDAPLRHSRRRRPRRRARAPAGGSVAHRIHRRCRRRDRLLGRRRASTLPKTGGVPGFCARREERRTSLPACARRVAWARAATSPPRAPLPRAPPNLRFSSAYLAACGLREQELPYNNIIAFNEARPCCTIKGSSGARPPRATRS